MFKISQFSEVYVLWCSKPNMILQSHLLYNVIIHGFLKCFHPRFVGWPSLLLHLSLFGCSHIGRYMHSILTLVLHLISTTSTLRLKLSDLFWSLRSFCVILKILSLEQRKKASFIISFCFEFFESFGGLHSLREFTIPLDGWDISVNIISKLDFLFVLKFPR
jgi:hypothetical protein